MRKENNLKGHFIEKPLKFIYANMSTSKNRQILMLLMLIVFENLEKVGH